MAHEVLTEQCTNEARKRAKCVKKLIDTALQEDI